MVKKKKAAKKAAKKTAPKRAAKKAKAGKGFNGAERRRAAKTAKGPKKPKGPEQQELMPGVRYADLDRYCRNIGENRDEINASKGEGKSLEAGALRAMRSHGVTHYKGSGVYLSIVPGDEKLLVKRDRGGSADGGQVEPEPEPDEDAGGGETGTGQDAGNIAENLTEKDEE